MFTADRLRSVSDDNLLLSADAVDTDVHDVSRPDPIAPGTIIDDRYRLVERLARGGMSWVFLAEQTNIRRRVAIKVIRKRYSEDEIINARVRREARALAHVRHPNVVAVHDVGVTEGGQAFIVMELVDGPSLADVLREEDSLGIERSLQLLLQIARALAAVHTRGMVHRDLKPGNVLLARDDGYEQAKVGDFGLAKVIRDRSALDSFRTRAGTILGTPEYMAPEQVQGAEVDHRADIYSFGCLAFEMLTGAPPFVGDEMSVLYKHLHDAPPGLPGGLAPARGAPALNTLIARCLAKKPRDRFSDAIGLYSALLDAADACGVPRHRLRLVESLHRDPAYTAVQATQRTELIQTPSPRLQRWLVVAVVAVLAAIAGVVGERYLMTSAGGDPAGAPLRSPLLVHSSPPGATVELDGRAVGVTPLAVPGVADGRHQVRIVLDGYEPIDRAITVDPGERLVDVRLAAERIDRRVRSSPAGARVYVDGALVEGATPVTIEVEPDEFYQLRLEKDGFAPAVVNLTPEHEGTVEAYLEPETQPVGYVWVDSGDMADIWINGAPSGFVSPSTGIRLRTGEHQVELRDSTGRRSQPVSVSVERGAHVHVRLSLPGGGG